MFNNTGAKNIGMKEKLKTLKNLPKSKFLSILLVFLIMLLSAYASEPTKPVASSQESLLTHTNQYYSVFFDGEGEAVVALKIKLTNQDSTPISKINIEIPGNQISILGMLQEIPKSQECEKYNTQCVSYTNGECNYYNKDGLCISYQQICSNSQEVCSYYRPSYGAYDYSKLEISQNRLSNSVLISTELGESVTSNSQATFIVFYKSKDYASNSLGTFKFDFETAKVDFQTNSLRIAVNVQEEYYLKGTTSTVNYRSNFAGVSSALSAKSISSEASSSISSYSNAIEYQQGLVKTSSYLDPHESFTMKGEYGSSWLALNWGKLLIWIVVIAAGIYGIFLAIRKLFRYISERTPQGKAGQSQTSLAVPFLTGLVGGIIVAAVWLVITIAIYSAGRLRYYWFSEIFALFLILFGILLSLAILVGLPIYVGLRFGAMQGLATVGFILMWIFIFAVVAFVVSALIITPYSYRGSVQVLEAPGAMIG